MSEAQVFSIEDLLLGKPYTSVKRGNGWIVQADRKGNADKWRGDVQLAAYAIRVRRGDMSFIHGTEDYWQTIYVDMEVGA